MRSVLLFLTLVSIAAIACKTKPKSKGSEAKSTAVAEVQKKDQPKANPLFKDGSKLLKDETLKPEEEYQKYKESIAKYKQSKDYKKPKTKVDKVVNSLADGADRVSKKDYVDLLGKGDCKKYRDRIENNIGTIEAAANIIHHEVTGKEAADDQDSDPSEPLTSHAAKAKSPLLQGTGIALVVFGALGFIGQIPMGAAIAGVGVEEDSSSFNVKAAAAYEALAFGLNLWPIIVGSLIIANEETDKRLVNAAKANLIYGSILPFLVAVVTGAAAFMGLAAWKEQWDTIRRENAHKAQKVPVKQGVAEESRIKDVELEDYFDTSESEKELKKAKEFTLMSGVLSIAAFSLGTGLAIWASKLELADAKLAPKEELLARTGRALVACSVMAERSGASKSQQ